MRALAAILLALVVAGCLEGDSHDAHGTPALSTPATASAPGAPTTTLTPTPTPTTNASDASVDEVAVGQYSGHHAAYRQVITWEHGWNEFWATHASEQSPPAPQPTVDFAASRLVAVVLGDKPNSCWGVRISDYRLVDDEASVTITTYTPPAEAMCASVLTQPFHVVAVPLGPDVHFVEETRVGPPPG